MFLSQITNFLNMNRGEIDQVIEYMIQNDFTINEICFVEGLIIPHISTSEGRQLEQLVKVSKLFLIPIKIIRSISVLEFYKEIEHVIKDREFEEVKIMMCPRNVKMMDLLMEEKNMMVSEKNSAYVFHANKIFTLSNNSEKEEYIYWYNFFSEISSTSTYIDLFKCS